MHFCMAVIISAELNTYYKFIPNSDDDGLMCLNEVILPQGSPTLFTSLYSPQRVISRRPFIEINLSRRIGGDFKCMYNPNVGSLHSDSNVWSGSNLAWVDMYRFKRYERVAWTRPASKKLTRIHISLS